MRSGVRSKTARRAVLPLHAIRELIGWPAGSLIESHLDKTGRRLPKSFEGFLHRNRDSR